MKTLVLIRHAYALSALDAGVTTDELRPLSDAGRQKAALTAARLSRLNLQPDLILTSPLLRAVQTAQTVAATWQLPVEQVTELNGLLPETELADFLHKRLAHADTLVVVGHNPNMACLYPLLCREMRGFAPGSFAVLQGDGNGPWKTITFGE